MITETDISKINKRYSDRFKLNGYSPKTLGWSDKKQQELFNELYDNKFYAKFN